MRKIYILKAPPSSMVVVVVLILIGIGIGIDNGLDSIDVVSSVVLLVTILLLLMSVAGV